MRFLKKNQIIYMGFVLSLHPTTYHFCPHFLSLLIFVIICVLFFCFYALSPPFVLLIIYI